jgi:hypothetical protein
MHSAVPRTTTLFAALDVASGSVVHQCMPRHRHQEELLFSELERRQLKRLAVTNVNELITAIRTYLDRRNTEPKPVVWPLPPTRSCAKSVAHRKRSRT